VELARVTSKGQITIPKEIRDKLNLKEGDKVIFLEEGNKIIFTNSSMVALKEIQEGMKGEAEKQKINNEDDVIQLVKEIRKEASAKRYAGNA